MISHRFNPNRPHIMMGNPRAQMMQSMAKYLVGRARAMHPVSGLPGGGQEGFAPPPMPPPGIPSMGQPRMQPMPQPYPNPIQGRPRAY